MDRIEWIEIEGKKYPLCCSLGAMEKITNIYNEKLDAIETNIKALAVLMEYGVRRARLFDEQEVPDALTADELTAILFFEDYGKVVEAVTKTIEKGQKHEIEGRSKGKKAEA